MSRLNVLTLVLVLTATSVFAQMRPDDIPVRVQIAPTALEQISRSETILTDAQREKDAQQRLRLVLTALASFDVVRTAWPKDTAAVTHAAIRQADIALEYGMVRNAIESLEQVRAKDGSAPVPVERRIGRAWLMLQDNAAAERHLLAAEKRIARGDAPLADADTALNDLAQLYVRTGRPREAVGRLRAAAALPGQPAMRAATLLLHGARIATNIADDPDRREARLLAVAAEKQLRAARAAKGNAAAASIAAAEGDLARLRAKFGL